MAISSFTGNLADTIAKINELSAANDWGITASQDGTPYNKTLAISNSDGNIFMRVTGIDNTSSGYHGIRCEYNGGSSNVSAVENAYSGARTATIYATSHGFIIVNDSSSTLSAGFVNINDDGSIVYGCNVSTSSANDLYSYVSAMKYDESSYQSLGFNPHTSPSGTTLCNAPAVGSLGDPQIAKYMFYAPVYQATNTGEVEVDGERYVSLQGLWYMKD